MGYGEGGALVYILAPTKEVAKQLLINELNFKDDPHFISGDVTEISEFVQPKLITVLTFKK